MYKNDIVHLFFVYTNDKVRRSRPNMFIHKETMHSQASKMNGKARHGLRILFLSGYDPFVSETGPAAHLRGLSQSLCRLGCEVHILVLNPENGRRVVNGVQLHHLSPSRNPLLNIPVVKDLFYSLTSSREVTRLCRKYPIDIIHGQSPSSYGYGLLREANMPFVVTLHGTSFGEFGSYFGLPLSFINRDVIFGALSEMLAAVLTCVEYKCADKVIAVSKATAEETVRYYHLPKDHVVAIHNGIDLPILTDSKVEENIEEPTILSVGRLSWRKGYKYLIDAMLHVLSEYPDTKLVIVGYGNQKIPLQRYVKKLGIESSVCFLGSVSGKKLHSLYHEADVYAQPSLYEPFGITILEAMSMRKPIVSTRVGGIPELVTNNVEGLLVEPRNSLQLAKAIINVLSDSSCRRRLGDNARKRVEREFTWEAIAKKTIQFYTKILDDK